MRQVLGPAGRRSPVSGLEHLEEHNAASSLLQMLAEASTHAPSNRLADMEDACTAPLHPEADATVRPLTWSLCCTVGVTSMVEMVVLCTHFPPNAFYLLCCTREPYCTVSDMYETLEVHSEYARAQQCCLCICVQLTAWNETIPERSSQSCIHGAVMRTGCT